MLVQKPPLSVAVRFWWALTWRTLLVSIPFYSLGRILGARLVVSMGLSGEKAYAVETFVASVPYIPLTVGVIHYLLGKKLGNFRLGVVADSEGPQASS